MPAGEAEEPSSISHGKVFWGRGRWRGDETRQEGRLEGGSGPGGVCGWQQRLPLDLISSLEPQSVSSILQQLNHWYKSE